jgi:hypothetical protein
LGNSGKEILADRKGYEEKAMIFVSYSKVIALTTDLPLTKATYLNLPGHRTKVRRYYYKASVAGQKG